MGDDGGVLLTTSTLLMMLQLMLSANSWVCYNMIPSKILVCDVRSHSDLELFSIFILQ